MTFLIGLGHKFAGKKYFLLIQSLMLAFGCVDLASFFGIQIVTTLMLCKGV
jgi:hypothetical protein